MGKKLMLVIVAAALGIIVGAGFADALDDNRILSGGKAAGMDGGSKEPARQIQITNVILKNGLKARTRDNRMFIIGADGKQSPAKDGTYELTDGRKITVRNGAIIDMNRAIIDVNRSIIETN